MNDNGEVRSPKARYPKIATKTGWVQWLQPKVRDRSAP
jgi:hypothetical protein